MKTIIHIEDADIVYDQVRKGVDDWFGSENAEVKNLDFEKAAENFIEAGESENIALIIVDLMIEYHSDENHEIPRDVLLDGSFDAGFRLIGKLRASRVWRDVPITVYSSVDRKAVEERLEKDEFRDIPVVQKTETLNPLLLLIGQMAGLRRIDR
jgi:hypothetical protein